MIAVMPHDDPAVLTAPAVMDRDVEADDVVAELVRRILVGVHQVARAVVVVAVVVLHHGFGHPAVEIEAAAVDRTLARAVSVRLAVLDDDLPRAVGPDPHRPAGMAPVPASVVVRAAALDQRAVDASNQDAVPGMIVVLFRISGDAEDLAAAHREVRVRIFPRPARLLGAIRPDPVMHAVADFAVLDDDVLEAAVGFVVGPAFHIDAGSPEAGNLEPGDPDARSFVAPRPTIEHPHAAGPVRARAFQAQVLHDDAGVREEDAITVPGQDRRRVVPV